MAGIGIISTAINSFIFTDLKAILSVELTLQILKNLTKLGIFASILTSRTHESEVFLEYIQVALDEKNKRMSRGKLKKEEKIQGSDMNSNMIHSETIEEAQGILESCEKSMLKFDKDPVTMLQESMTIRNDNAINIAKLERYARVVQNQNPIYYPKKL